MAVLFVPSNDAIINNGTTLDNLDNESKYPTLILPKCSHNWFWCIMANIFRKQQILELKSSSCKECWDKVHKAIDAESGMWTVHSEHSLWWFLKSWCIFLKWWSQPWLSFHYASPSPVLRSSSFLVLFYHPIVTAVLLGRAGWYLGE